MKTFDLEQYGLVHPIQLKVSVYHYGKNIAIQMITHENGYAEPWSNLTVNPDYILPLNCAYIDTNNNGKDIISWVEHHKLATPTGRYGYSGFCKYPEYRFNDTLLQELDPIGYGDYLAIRK